MKYKLVVYGTGYHIDSRGNVYGKDGRVLKAHEGGNNRYLQVSLCHLGKAKKFLVHRLVALTFLENPEGKREVNHKDGDIQNNEFSNLEWVTPEENMLHSYHVLGNKGGCAPMLGKSGKEHNKSKSIKIKTPSGEVREFGSVLEMTRETGYSNTAVCWVVKNKTLPYTGLKGVNKGMTVLAFDF